MAKICLPPPVVLKSNKKNSKAMLNINLEKAFLEFGKYYNFINYLLLIIFLLYSEHINIIIRIMLI